METIMDILEPLADTIIHILTTARTARHMVTIATSIICIIPTDIRDTPMVRLVWFLESKLVRQ